MPSPSRTVAPGSSASALPGTMSLPRRLPLVPVLPLEECVLDFIMDTQEPSFRACGTIAKMCGFSLQFSSPFFGGAQLK